MVPKGAQADNLAGSRVYWKCENQVSANLPFKSSKICAESILIVHDRSLRNPHPSL
jgi:hypothetical protein